MHMQLLQIMGLFITSGGAQNIFSFHRGRDAMLEGRVWPRGAGMHIQLL